MAITKFLLFLVLVCLTSSCHGLIFMRNVAIGNLIALAIPLWSNDPYLSNTFMSYNFESNYGASTSAPDFTNAYLDKFMLPYDKFDQDLDDYRRRPLGGVRRRRSFWKEEPETREKRQQLTRKNVYRVIESYVTKECLLRTICEAAMAPLSKYDGVLGDILHIILTPSTSLHEGMGDEYFEAETIGRTTKSCLEFTMACPTNGLDLFTTYF